ncbi:MAG: hypothetical protein ACJAZ4_001795 [Neptuniibacter pectenicola]
MFSELVVITTIKQITVVIVFNKHVVCHLLKSIIFQLVAVFLGVLLRGILMDFGFVLMQVPIDANCFGAIEERQRMPRGLFK